MTHLADGTRVAFDGGARSTLQVVFRADHAHGVTAEGAAEAGAEAVARNRALGLTGIFCAQGRMFVGFLEGPSDAVIARIEEISKDPRQTGLVILREALVEKPRMFNTVFGYLTSPEPRADETECARAFADKLARALQRAA